MKPEELKRFLADRDEALLSLDENKLNLFYSKYNLGLHMNQPNAWVGIHKARTACTSLPMAARSESKKWLKARGYASLDDGDVP